MLDASQIKNGASIVGSDGAKVGTVDCVEGDARVRLLSTSADATGPDFIPLSWTQEVSGDIIRLNRTGADVLDGINDEIPAGEETS